MTSCTSSCLSSDGTDAQGDAQGDAQLEGCESEGRWTRRGKVAIGLLVLTGVSLTIQAWAEGEQGTGTQQGPRDAEGFVDRLAMAQNTQQQQHPFPKRQPAPDFPTDLQWTNTGGPLRLRDLRGKFVLLDFWTYCCINCLHVLPELKKLERAYPNELVVIGVHAAKFDAEKDLQNIQEAILRYEIEHPVVNDPDHRLWQRYGVQSWPSLRMIDPEGNYIAGDSGEFRFEQIDAFLKRALPHYRSKKLLDPTPIHFDLLAHQQAPTPLRFPGKVLADADGGRLFITDSNHNRIVVTTLEGELLEVIGNGSQGRANGDYKAASFHHPQGLALDGHVLWVADTENHMIRRVDLRSKQVSTVAGTGRQGLSPWLKEQGSFTGRLPRPLRAHPAKTAINSPWALWVHGRELFIAMAGPHQIWVMTLDGKRIGPYAGNGREDIVDGQLLPDRAYSTSDDEGRPVSSFAQPSGLASDGTLLYVADSEGSSVRAVPLNGKGRVVTVVGTSQLPQGRLFRFGDRDGPREDVLLQHALGVAYHDGQLFVADTYNNKIKQVDVRTGRTKTLAGTGQPGDDNQDADGTLDEPSGLAYARGTLYVADTNNHAIRTLNVSSGQMGTLAIAGLQPPVLPGTAAPPDFADAERVAVPLARVRPAEGVITLQVHLELPEGWKINAQAPVTYYLEAQQGRIARQSLGAHRLPQPAARFDVPLRLAGEGRETVKLSLPFYYCAEGGEGLCKIGQVVFSVPLEVTAEATTASVRLSHRVQW